MRGPVAWLNINLRDWSGRNWNLSWLYRYATWWLERKLFTWEITVTWQDHWYFANDLCALLFYSFYLVSKIYKVWHGGRLVLSHQQPQPGRSLSKWGCDCWRETSSWRLLRRNLESWPPTQGSSEVQPKRFLMSPSWWERHQVLDRWGQTRSVFSNLGTWVLPRKEFRAKSQTIREHPI